MPARAHYILFMCPTTQGDLNSHTCLIEGCIIVCCQPPTVERLAYFQLLSSCGERYYTHTPVVQVPMWVFLWVCLQDHFQGVSALRPGLTWKFFPPKSDHSYLNHAT